MAAGQRYLPVVFVWRDVELIDDDGVARHEMAMVPLGRYSGVCRRQYHEGEEYPLAPLEARSRESHSQYFAAINDGFQNLPEDLAMVRERLGLRSIPPDGWINTEHLRKWALCETGWCETSEFDFETQKEATRLAQFYRAKDSYALIMVRGSHVTIKTALSQSAASMSKEPFEKSKRDVLTLIETIVGLPKGSLKKNAGKVA